MVGRFGSGLVSDLVPGSLVRSVIFGLSLMLLLVFPFVESGWPSVLLHGFVAALGIAAAGWAGVFVSEVLRLAPPGESARAIAGGYVFTWRRAGRARLIPAGIQDPGQLRSDAVGRGSDGNRGLPAVAQGALRPQSGQQEHSDGTREGAVVVVRGYSTALTMSSTTFLASPKTIMVLSM